jgi:hypothetical protein
MVGAPVTKTRMTAPCGVDAEGEVVGIEGPADDQAHHQQARSLQPVRHVQAAGVQRAQGEALDER